MTNHPRAYRPALALLAIASFASASWAQTGATNPVPLAPETEALAKCMATRNPDAFRARRLANSLASRNPEGRRIAAVLSTSLLGCPESLGASFEKANLVEATVAATSMLTRDGDSAAPVPVRRMTALATCLVSRHPAAARKFVNAAEAAASSAKQTGSDRSTLSFSVDVPLVTAVLTRSDCSDPLDKIDNRIDSSELYAEVLRQLPGPAATPFALHPIAETELRHNPEKANPALRPLAACLWKERRDRALTIVDGKIAAGSGDFPVKLRRGDFESCGGETSVPLAMANAFQLADNLYLIRLNQLARCLVARDRAGLEATLANLTAEGSKVFEREKSSFAPELAVGMKPFAGGLLDTMESCDITVSDQVNGNGTRRQMLLAEIKFELKRTVPGG